MMASERLTVSELAKAAGIPERTLRRYIERHGAYLDARVQGGRVTLGPGAAAILRRIRDLYGQGMDAEQVDAALAASLPATVTVAGHMAAAEAEALGRMLERVAEAMADVAEEQRRQAEEIARLRQELAATRELLECQENERRLAEQERDLALEERDRRLMQLIRELQTRRTPWWRRWWRGRLGR